MKVGIEWLNLRRSMEMRNMTPDTKTERQLASLIDKPKRQAHGMIRDVQIHL